MEEWSDGGDEEGRVIEDDFEVSNQDSQENREIIHGNKEQKFQVADEKYGWGRRLIIL